ncbi:hypothetical protein G3H63_01975 [Microbacterium resistens]|uniref:hypothetical protein n=1 Tax=Microbacterium resistens TaxID=156977 RepID=UPI001C588847|nr:hypothetical protein [Microbacterium resistens]MBW1637853.1 hypothetical protein [Microbacterium resistens]
MRRTALIVEAPPSRTLVTLRRGLASDASLEFGFSLTHVGWFSESILWIGPERPGPFTELTDAVARAFPDFPPYEGRHDGSVQRMSERSPEATYDAEGAASPLLHKDAHGAC